MDTISLVTMLLAAGVGAVVCWLATVPALRERLLRARTEADLLRERVTDLEGSAAQDRELAATLSPLSSTLTRVEQQVRTLERDRVEQYARLGEQIESVRASGEALRVHTSALAGALRAPTSRGAWGEVQLRRVVEHAGMLARVDFTEQARGTDPDGVGVRPDLVVHLPGGKNVVVDAKAPLAAFLEASEGPNLGGGGPDGAGHDDGGPDGERRLDRAARRHARALRSHVDALAAKEYWRVFDPSPELVICFVPGEAFLSAACAADPSLMEHAMARRVVLATPTTLLALLRTVALTWQSEVLSGSAREVFVLGRDLYARLSTLGGHTTRLGRSLERAVEDYNAMVGTLERRVLVSARRLHDLGLGADEPTAPPPLEVVRRPVTAAELVTGAEPVTGAGDALTG